MTRSLFILLSVLLLQPLAWSQTTDNLKLADKLEPITQANFFEEEGYATWGGHIVKEGDSYYLIYSRWKTKGGDWLTTSEIAIAQADDLAGPYRHLKVLLKGSGKGHWNELMAHNPKLKKFGDTWHLYFISSRPGKSRNHIRDSQRIGVATSTSITGPFVPSTQAIVEPAKPVFNITVNPGVTQRPDGSYLMILKGDIKAKTPEQAMPQRIQGLATSPTPTGPFSIQPQPAISGMDTEDASLWYDTKRKRYYAIFHAHHYIGLITSTDGIQWDKAQHSKVTGKSFPSPDGKAITVGSIERPFLYIEDGQAKALCLSTRRKGKGYNHGRCLIIPLKP
ncbi:hypothetical protein HW115_05505 [Verrucomicrobiaceae bacterium N1E253]|uniref:Glycosyl hydrolase family 43 n=1 Tax=Oceaniferula marina TaxID=2748318 RepID=A0A851GIM1_9BACT|nr:glycoside hydrolase family protein [Oceaniferula marina]NWK55055.1 hypothetical protein [Oceaniferula marina]